MHADQVSEQTLHKSKEFLSLVDLAKSKMLELNEAS